MAADTGVWATRLVALALLLATPTAKAWKIKRACALPPEQKSNEANGFKEWFSETEQS